MRACTVPAGAAILIPVINAASWIPTWGADDAAIRADATATIDPTTVAVAEVDGVAVPIERVVSPFFWMTAPQRDALFDGLAGTHRAVADGYWAFLRPLSPGTHTVHIHGEADYGAGGTFATDVTYHLTVTPRSAAGAGPLNPSVVPVSARPLAPSA